MTADEIEIWLEKQLEIKKLNNITNGIGKPTNSKGEKYYIDGCYADQN